MSRAAMADNWLKDYGFNVLALPRRDLRPGDVLFRSNGDFGEKVGNLGMVFDAAQPQPDATTGEPVADIGRSIEKKVEASLGVKILGALFGGGASSKLGADLGAKHARNLVVSYENVEEDSIPVLELQSWVSAAKPKLTGEGAGWLNDDKLATVTAVLRTKTLSVVAERENGAAIDLSVPEIKGLIGGDAKVDVDSKTASKVTFTGEDAIAFGFQAYVLVFEGMVSFGIRRVRDLDETAVDPADYAWTSQREVELRDRVLPSA